jgi:hypothetical protein
MDEFQIICEKAFQIADDVIRQAEYERYLFKRIITVIFAVCMFLKAQQLSDINDH